MRYVLHVQLRNGASAVAHVTIGRDSDIGFKLPQGYHLSFEAASDSRGLRCCGASKSGSAISPDKHVTRQKSHKNNQAYSGFALGLASHPRARLPFHIPPEALLVP